MRQEFLDNYHLLFVRDEEGRESVPERMPGKALVDPQPLNKLLNVMMHYLR